MITDRMLTRPLVVSAPGAPLEDEDGEPVTDDRGHQQYGEPTEATVNGYVEQTSTSEETVDQQTAPARWWAALPAGTPVAATSKITIPDSAQTFQVVGEPATRWHPWRKRAEFIRVELGSET